MTQADIVIYQDEGVGAFSMFALTRALQYLKKPYRTAGAQDIIQGALKPARHFIVPGGADIPYTRKLNGTGNAAIRSFVETGGHYIGICAGAYYACRAIEYHKGRADEICEPRELALLPLTAIGSLPDLAPYYDATLASAAITPLRLENQTITHAYYHGGPRFEGDFTDLTILARYGDLPDAPPAIVQGRVDSGRVTLCGAHIEVTANALDSFVFTLQESTEKTALSNSLRTSAQTGMSLFERLLS